MISDAPVWYGLVSIPGRFFARFILIPLHIVPDDISLSSVTIANILLLLVVLLWVLTARVVFKADSMGMTAGKKKALWILWIFLTLIIAIPVIITALWLSVAVLFMGAMLGNMTT